MYTVLLADDEESVLEILMDSVPWQEMGVDALLTASDGLAALDIIEERQVDLLITDIRMPRMDGLALIRRVRQIRPDTRCVLLTAYGEFDYAREAIELGVENYLLKPVRQEEVEQTVKKALENIYANYENNNWLLRDNTLYRWISGEIGVDELADRAVHLGLNLYLPKYVVICVTKKRRIALSPFYKRVHEDLSPTYETHYFWDERGRYILILGARSIDMARLGERMTGLARELGLDDGMAIALGEPVDGFEELPLSYRTALASVRLNAPLTMETLLPSSRMTDESSGPAAEEMLIAFFDPDESAAMVRLRDLAQRSAAKLEKSPDALLELMKSCVRALLAEYPSHDDIQHEVYSRRGELAELARHEGGERAVYALLSGTYRRFGELFEEYSPVVKLAMRYVRARYAQGISIRDFCVTRNVNPAYLGHIFRKESGVFFNEYLTRVRIAHSTLLLRDPGLRIKDIAAMVGFSSTSYFVKCFRAQKGESPACYRTEQYSISLADD